MVSHSPGGLPRLDLMVEAGFQENGSMGFELAHLLFHHNILPNQVSLDSESGGKDSNPWWGELQSHTAKSMKIGKSEELWPLFYQGRTCNRHDRLTDTVRRTKYSRSLEISRSADICMQLGQGGIGLEFLRRLFSSTLHFINRFSLHSSGDCLHLEALCIPIAHSNSSVITLITLYHISLFNSLTSFRK